VAAQSVSTSIRAAPSVGNQAEKPHPLPGVTDLFPHDTRRSRLVARRAHNPKVAAVTQSHYLRPGILKAAC
jgi:hypothetical protein